MVDVRLIDLTAQFGAIGLPSKQSLLLARTLIDSEPDTDISVLPGLIIQFNHSVHSDALEARLRDAAERVSSRRRGRPSARKPPAYA